MALIFNLCLFILFAPAYCSLRCATPFMVNQLYWHRNECLWRSIKGQASSLAALLLPHKLHISTLGTRWLSRQWLERRLLWLEAAWLWGNVFFLRWSNLVNDWKSWYFGQQGQFELLFLSFVQKYGKLPMPVRKKSRKNKFFRKMLATARHGLQDWMFCRNMFSSKVSVQGNLNLHFYNKTLAKQTHGYLPFFLVSRFTTVYWRVGGDVSLHGLPGWSCSETLPPSMHGGNEGLSVRLPPLWWCVGVVCRWVIVITTLFTVALARRQRRDLSVFESSCHLCTTHDGGFTLSL